MKNTARVGVVVICTAAILVLAVVIILPRIFHAGGTFDEATGAWNVRVLITAEVTYSSTYPDLGYAPNLAALGPDPADAPYDKCQATPGRACLIDAQIGCSSGTGSAWCADRVYRYNIQSSSSRPPYKNYWITATPLRASPERKNYCATSDAVLRSESGAPLSRPYTQAECEKLQVDDPGAYVAH